nr:hypothetical protein [Bradyrhizobium japonicum]
MDTRDNDFLHFVRQALSPEMKSNRMKSNREIAVGALKGFLDVRYGARDGPDRGVHTKGTMRMTPSAVADEL